MKQKTQKCHFLTFLTVQIRGNVPEVVSEQRLRVQSGCSMIQICNSCLLQRKQACYSWIQLSSDQRAEPSLYLWTFGTPAPPRPGSSPRSRIDRSIAGKIQKNRDRGNPSWSPAAGRTSVRCCCHDQLQSPEINPDYPTKHKVALCVSVTVRNQSLRAGRTDSGRSHADMWGMSLLRFWLHSVQKKDKKWPSEAIFRYFGLITDLQWEPEAVLVEMRAPPSPMVGRL